MAVPSYLSNVLDKDTNTFGDWFERTQSLSDDMGSKVVTVETNSVGGVTTGNASIVGIFSANTLATDILRGGSVENPGPLSIEANTTVTAFSFTANTALASFSGNTFVITSNTVTTTSNTFTVTANTVTINSTSRMDVNTDILVSGNISTNSSIIVAGSANVSGDLFVSSNTTLAAANVETLSISGTDAMKLPVGTTLERPTGIKGHARFNDTDGRFEVFDGSQWIRYIEDSDTLIVQTFEANTVSSGLITAESYIETHNEVSSNTNIVEIDLRTGNLFSHVMSENTTFSFTNAPANGLAHGFTLEIIQDSLASGYTVNWPNVKWPKKKAPTLTSTANGVDVCFFYTRDGGTSWNGFVAGQDQGVVVV